MNLLELVNENVLVTLTITAVVFFFLGLVVGLKHKNAITGIKAYLWFVSVTYFVIALTSELLLGISLSIYIHVLWVAANIQLLWLSAGETIKTFYKVKDLKDKLIK